MTIEQRKISLIKWITSLEDESVIDQIEDFRNSTLDELPDEIVELLKISDSTKKQECIEHTNSREVLNR
jgi:hypothetical protein